MRRVARILKWLLALAALALFAVAGTAPIGMRAASATSWPTAPRRRPSSMAARLGVRQINDDTYVVDLAWQDQSGCGEHREGLAAVVAALGRQLVAGEAGDPPTLLIKYHGRSGRTRACHRSPGRARSGSQRHARSRWVRSAARCAPSASPSWRCSGAARHEARRCCTLFPLP